MGRVRIRKDGHFVWIDQYDFDPSPYYAVREVKMPYGTTRFDHSVAFDPMYGPANEGQIEYHRLQGKLDTTDWEVGKPVVGVSGNKRGNG